MNSKSDQYNLQELREKINTIIEFQSDLTEREQREFLKTPSIQEKLKEISREHFEASPVPSPTELYDKDGEAVGISAYNQELGETLFYRYEEVNYNSEINLPSISEDTTENREKLEEKERKEEIEKLQQLEQQRLEEEQAEGNKNFSSPSITSGDRIEPTSTPQNQKQMEL